jgi:hypothetical protein
MKVLWWLWACCLIVMLLCLTAMTVRATLDIWGYR